MSKIVLDDIKSGYNLGKINSNFEKIEQELNNKVLYRDTSGIEIEPNQVEQAVDMNSNRILNLPKPINPTDAVRLQDISEGIIEDGNYITIPSVSEKVSITDGQLVVTFTEQTTTGAEFHINGVGVDSRLLTSDDYNQTTVTDTTITLLESYPDGTTVTLTKNTGKGEQVDAGIRREFVHNIDTLAIAVANTKAVAGDAANLKERTTGNGGGAMWEYVLASTVTPNTFDIVACTGVPTLALVLRNNYDSIVLRIPSQYPDLQTAMDTHRKTGAEGDYTSVTLFIESGHLLTKGLECTRGDFGNFQIASADAVVSLDPAFVGVPVEQNPTNGEVPRPPLCYGFHARMPRWNVTIDMGNLYGSGLLLINCSTYASAGHGVINAGFRGWQQRAGYGFASNTNWSGATGTAVRVQKAGICNIGDANLTFACKTEDQGTGALYVSRSCMVEARGADMSDSGAGGIVCRRSTVTAVDCHADRCVQAAFECQSGGVIDAVNSFCEAPQNEAYYSRFGGTVIASGATVTNPNIPSRIFVCDDGAQMVVNAGTTVDATAINETHLNANVPQFNVTYGDGLVSHPDKQAVVESGSNANGTWQKFADGRMVVETGIQNIDITVASGVFSAQIAKPTLPQTFVAVHHINEKVVGKQNAGGGGADIFVHSCSNQGVTGNEWKVLNTGQQIDGAVSGLTVQSVQIRMQVFGTWK